LTDVFSDGDNAISTVEQATWQHIWQKQKTCTSSFTNETTRLCGTGEGLMQLQNQRGKQ